jgi:integrase
LSLYQRQAIRLLLFTLKLLILLERHRNTDNLSNQSADLLDSVGLRGKRNHKSTGKGRGNRREVEPLSFHSLRRTATRLLLEAGVPAAVAQALLDMTAKRCTSSTYRLVAKRWRSAEIPEQTEASVELVCAPAVRMNGNVYEGALSFRRLFCGE